MNKLNLEAINELFAMPPNATGINENFYWAVAGNWPWISAHLKAHFSVPPEELTMQQSALSAGASVIQRAINADPKEWGGATALADAVYKAMRADLMRYLPSPLAPTISKEQATAILEETDLSYRACITDDTIKALRFIAYGHHMNGVR